jgi:hypothetical protein
MSSLVRIIHAFCTCKLKQYLREMSEVFRRKAEDASHPGTNNLGLITIAENRVI